MKPGAECMDPEETLGSRQLGEAFRTTKPDQPSQGSRRFYDEHRAREEFEIDQDTPREVEQHHQHEADDRATQGLRQQRAKHDIQERKRQYA